MLGEGFYQVFKKDYLLKCTDIDVNESWLSYLDFRDAEAYLKDVKDFKPDYLFHLGAYTDLEFCDINPEATYLTNTVSVETAVRISNELDIPLLYISTAGIFDGKKDVYDEEDIANPLGHYAKSKYMGEVFVEKNKRDYLICRAGWMMGAGPKKDKKFIQKLMQQIKDGKQELFVVDDKLGTPTYTHDFASNVKLLLEKKCWGLYNMVCRGVTGRLQVAQELVKLLGVQHTVKITSVDSSYWAKEYFSIRPASERLVDKKLTLQGLYTMRDWRICLDEYIKLYYKGYLEQ
jgi:dTDP-4-dehydrorhamnose reductase